MTRLHALAAAVRAAQRIADERPGVSSHVLVALGQRRRELLEAVEALPADVVLVERTTLVAARDALNDLDHRDVFLRERDALDALLKEKS